MKIILPMTVDNTALLASNVAENDYSEWDIGTTYNAGDFVIVTGTTHKIYESATGSNLGNDPTTDGGVNWTEISATNRWKAFDNKTRNPVSKVGAITYSIQPSSMVTGIGFRNLVAATVQVEVYDTESPANLVYDQTQVLFDTSEIVSWFTFFTFDATNYDTEALFLGLPGYAGTQIDITIGDGTGTAKVGEIVLGKMLEFGDAVDGTEVGFNDYSTDERDAFGDSIVVERGYTEYVNFSFAMASADARRLQRALIPYRARPVLFFAHEDIQRLGATIFGRFSDFRIPLSSGGTSFVSIEVESV